MPRSVTLIDSVQLQLIINRLCYSLIENHDRFENSVIIGLQPRGVEFAEQIFNRLQSIQPKYLPQYGILDATFYRDDFRRNDKQLLAHPTEISFSLEKQRVILIDDVLYTGRTIRAGLEGLLEFGRPQSIELMVLIDRRFCRELPIEPNYVGKAIDSYDDQLVKVQWAKDPDQNKISLITA